MVIATDAKGLKQCFQLFKYLILAFDKHTGSRYFCESFYGHPCPTSGKNYATANACDYPSRPASFVGYPARGIQHHSRNDSTRCRKACIFTTQKALRKNTCTIASGDYSTPVSQRATSSLSLFKRCHFSIKRPIPLPSIFSSHSVPAV